MLTYIPSSKEAYLRRGFDHAKLIAKDISHLLQVDVIDTFEPPSSKDQRELGRSQRSLNLEGKFQLKDSVKSAISRVFDNIILIDDVFTTGATLNNASLMLKTCGFSTIYCANFSRTF